MDDPVDFRGATRRLLFGRPEKHVPPGAGRSAAEAPERHVRVKVTMNFDGDIVAFFKQKAQDEGRAYQLLINQVLRDHIDGSRPEQMAREVGALLASDDSFLELIKARIQSTRAGGEVSTRSGGDAA